MLGILNRRLSIGVRLFWVATIFVLSSMLSAALLANYGWANIAFSQKELQGTAYNRQIWQAWQSGRTTIDGHEAFDAAFASADAYRDFTLAQDAVRRADKAATLIVAVADGSNLTLDPDLDSFYAMDVATVKLPALLNKSLALTQALQTPTTDPDRRIKIAKTLDRFETAEQAMLGSLDASIKNNAAGLTRAALQNHRDALQQTTHRMAAAAHAELDGTPNDYATAAAALPTVLDAAWLATNDELARLLERRIDRQIQGLYFNIAIVLVLIAVSLALTLLVVIGIKRRFHALDTAMIRLNRGDRTVEIPYLADRNETGRIAATLARMKQSLIEQAETERQHQEERAASEAKRLSELDEGRKLVVQTFGAGLKAMAEERFDFRLKADLPPAYMTLQDLFNRAIAISEQSKRDREEAAQRRQAERAAKRAAEAQQRAKEEARTQMVEQAVAVFGEGLSALAARDLTYRIQAEMPEGYRRIKDNFNRALEHLAEALREIDVRADDIAAATQHISGGAADMADRTERQAATLEETNTAVGEIAALVTQSADHAKEVSRQATKAFQNATQGETMAQGMVEAIQRIAASSTEISQIIGVIDEIAFQTNLLALNAGVEAARAGDAGRGFAVVATEVRALAQRSAAAAKQIKALIRTSEEQVEEGVNLVNGSGKVLKTIAEDIGRINRLMAEIAGKQDEQAHSLSEVSHAVDQMDQAMQADAALAEESNTAVHSMAQNAHALSELTAAFKTEQQRLLAAE